VPRGAGCALLVGVGFVLAFGSGGAWAVPAGAADVPAPGEAPAAITVRGTCPSAEAIWTSVMSIVPAKELDRLAAAARIEVSDQGDSYRVLVSAKGTDRLRIYHDPAHDCDHRARFAAVFIVLTLMPPDVLVDAPPPPPPEPPAPPPSPMPAPPPARPPPPVRKLRLELSAFAELAPAVLEAPPTTALGGEVRFVVGGPRLAVVGAVGLAPHVSFQVDGLDVKELRVPIDLGLRLTLASFRAVTLAADLGLAGAVFHLSGVATAGSEPATRFDLGARAALLVRFGAPTARLAPLVGLHVEAFPRPYDITLTPEGMLGRTPALWWGATIGLAIAP
jgi:hypothetical protein